jgi:hypothetical protein
MMRMRGIMIAAVTLAGWAAGAALGGPNAAATLAVDADWRTPAVEPGASADGPVFAIGIRISGARYLDGYAFELGYDTALAAFVGARAGSPEEGLPNFLETRGGTAVAFVGRLSVRDTSLITVANALAGSDSTRSPGGDGLLAILEFRAKGSGTVRFVPGKVELLDWRQTLDTAAAFQGGSVDIRIPVTARLRRSPPAGADVRWMDILGRPLGSMRAPGFRLAVVRNPRPR